jgi:hypothetical protein
VFGASFLIHGAYERGWSEIELATSNGPRGSVTEDGVLTIYSLSSHSSI